MDTKLLKQKILDLAIRGKLIPQDPNDEPASVLLEKIRKEKQELIRQGKIKKDKNESTIFVGDHKQHYEKFADGTVKNIENEIPFDIPETWSWCRFSELFELRNGFTPLRSNKLFWENGTMPWFTIDDKHNQGDFINYTAQHITDIAYKQERIVPKDSVLLCCTASIGEVAFNKISLITNQQFNGITVKSTFKSLISPMFLYYYCKTLKQYLIDIAGATTFGFVSLSKIGKTLFPFPCYSEQQRIVQKIEELFAQVDKIEEEKQELLKLIDKAKERVLDLAMKGKLVKQDPNDEPASVLLEKIFEEKKKLAKEGKIKLSKDELLAPQISDDNDYYQDLPKNWLVLNLGNICDVARGGSPRPIDKYLTTSNKDSYNWIKIGDTNIGEKYITKAKQKIIKEGLSHTRYVEKGDFLLSNSMSFGRPYILKIDGCIHDGWLVIHNTFKLLNQDYLYYLLSSKFMFEEMSQLAKGSTVKNLKSDTVKLLKIPIPPLLEQIRIVETVEGLLTKIEQIKGSL